MSTSVHDYRSATRELIVRLGRMMRANPRHKEAGLWTQVYPELWSALRKEDWARAQRLAHAIHNSVGIGPHANYQMRHTMDAAEWLHMCLDPVE